ncbi:hypothetical protein GCM10007036_06840 [Alsobacter metallidurans]|uniref:Putative Flp pilus-assembly TadG-like N-terminal domain-containing protein n=2 Tax=Alsobacter metallidurans TaxID=340221 RepID=A0A917I438_9HYPH|nr:hypothetical protein GCM10007036_06840 [Alsobacter metallidurans]
MLAMIGFAIDSTNMYRARNETQKVADSAALAAARELNQNPSSDGKVQSNNFLVANRAGTDWPDMTRTVSVDTANNKVTVVTSVTVKNYLGAFLGKGSQVVQSTATANYAVPVPIEIAIAFDVSGSMKKDGRGVEAKAGLKSFLDGISALPNAVVSFVPFTTVVKVDPNAYKSASWITWNASPLPSTSSGSWDGCIVDREKPLDASPYNFSGAAGADARYPATTCARSEWDATDWAGTGNAMVMPTKNLNAIKSRLGTIKYDGYTDITLGVSWAGTLLAPDGPIGLGKPWGPGTIKAMLIISDGQNTIHRWKSIPANHQAPHYAAMDADTKAACAEIKAKGVEIFTINVIEGSVDVLGTCSTDSNHYFLASSASQIGPQLQKVLAAIQKNTAIALSQ